MAKKDGITITLEGSKRIQKTILRMQKAAGTKEHGNLMKRIANNANDMIENRVTNQGLNMHGSKMPPYTEGHKKTRKKYGAQTALTNLSLTGDMFQSLINKLVGPNGKWGAILYFRRRPGRSPKTLPKNYGNTSTSDRAAYMHSFYEFFGLRRKEERSIFTMYLVGLRKIFRGK